MKRILNERIKQAREKPRRSRSHVNYFMESDLRLVPTAGKLTMCNSDLQQLTLTKTDRPHSDNSSSHVPLSVNKKSSSGEKKHLVKSGVRRWRIMAGLPLY